MSKTIHRVQFLDFMRGFAVIVMVMGHSIDSVLSLEARSTDAFRLYDTIRGFTAPLFLFISGFAFYVVTSRKWVEFSTFGPTVRRRILRMLFLLGLGYALHFPFFSLNKILHGTTPEEYAQMFQVDVLHCVAVSILLLQTMVMIAGTKQRFFLLTLGTTAAIVLATPFLWGTDLRPVLTSFFAPYFNQQQPAIFPLFPFGAYLLSGALTGWMYEALSRAGKPEFFPRLLVLVAIAGAFTGFVLDLLPWTILPSHDFWKANPNLFLIRIGVVVLVAAGFTYLRNLPPRVEAHLVSLGQASLTVYVVHLLLVYGSAANEGLMQVIGQSLGFPHAMGVAVGVLSAMFLLVWGWRVFKSEYAGASRVLQLAVTNAVVYFFLTRPY